MLGTMNPDLGKIPGEHLRGPIRRSIVHDEDFDRWGLIQRRLNGATKLIAAVLIGEAAEQLRTVLAESCPVHIAEDLPAAVRKSAELASPGSTVLLSPACASLDMFADYRERGDVFAASVRELIE